VRDFGWRKAHFTVDIVSFCVVLLPSHLVPGVAVKAKVVAQEINAAMEAAGLLDTWAGLKARAPKLSEPELKAEMQALREGTTAIVQPQAEAYMHFLSTSLGASLKDKKTSHAASYRATVLSTDQAWRAFCARLNPLSQLFVDPEALKRGLEQKFPGVYRLAWS